MPKIATENTKTLRQRMDAWVVLGSEAEVAVLSATNMTQIDGAWVSDEATSSGGTWASTPSLTVTASRQYTKISLVVNYSDTSPMPSEKPSIIEKTPTWSSNGDGTYSATLTFTGIGDSKYLIIEAVLFGDTWYFDSEDIISWSMVLRGVGTAIKPDLEASEIEIELYQKEDWTTQALSIGESTPIYISVGYVDDRSMPRMFYLSDLIEQENNRVTIKGNDYTAFLENFDGYYDSFTIFGGSRYWYFNGLKGAVPPNTYIDDSGVPYFDNDPLDINVYIPSGSKRTVLANATNLFRTSSFLINYRDAGRPILSSIPIAKTWEIYADQVANFKYAYDYPTASISAKLSTYDTDSNDTYISTISIESGNVYEVSSGNPVDLITWVLLLNGGAVNPTTIYKDTNTWKFVATTTGTYEVHAEKVVTETTEANDNYTVSSESLYGSAYALDEQPLMETSDYDDGHDAYSVTKNAMLDMLNRSSILCEFDYRGNPHMQPRDVINVEVASWHDIEYIGLFPADDLYPRDMLLPSNEDYSIRDIDSEIVQMTIDTITIQQDEGGGMHSRIVARKGTV